MEHSQIEYLPFDIFDVILDYIYSEQEALLKLCLVSKTFNDNIKTYLNINPLHTFFNDRTLAETAAQNLTARETYGTRLARLLKENPEYICAASKKTGYIPIDRFLMHMTIFHQKEKEPTKSNFSYKSMQIMLDTLIAAGYDLAHQRDNNGNTILHRLVMNQQIYNAIHSQDYFRNSLSDSAFKSLRALLKERVSTKLENTAGLQAVDCARFCTNIMNIVNDLGTQYGSTKTDQWFNHRKAFIYTCLLKTELPDSTEFTPFKIYMKLSELRKKLEGYPQYEIFPLIAYTNNIPCFAVIPRSICEQKAQERVTDSKADIVLGQAIWLKKPIEKIMPPIPREDSRCCDEGLDSIFGRILRI